MTEREKMISGRLYDPTDKELTDLRVNAHNLYADYNATKETDAKKRAEILKELAPNLGKDAFIQGPVYFDYGVNFRTGKNFYANFHFTVLDCAPVTVGDDAFIGPNVSLYTPVHPFLPEERNMKRKPDGAPYDLEYAKPIRIGNNCWLAGGVSVLGGVTIGDGCVIGAGSVVTRDIPANSLAAGNPCRVIRTLTENDKVKNLR